MSILKAGRKMVYECALTIKANNPQWDTRSCLEEAMRRCSKYLYERFDLKTLLVEYRENPDGEIQDYLSKVSKNNK